MRIKHFILFFTIAFLFSCAEDNDIISPRNLQEYIDLNSNGEIDNVIACAGNVSDSETVTYIFYYPIAGATDVSYYEISSVDEDEKVFSNYKRRNLTSESVFGGRLKRFIRTDSEDSWGIVTYIVAGKLHTSNPIRIKINSKPTTWSNEVTIEYPEITAPKFTWSDGTIQDNKIYFQLISDEENDDGEEEFISGTYTEELTFQFYDTSNVVLDINEGVIPDSLLEDEEYLFTMMAVSEDNWVNLVIQKTFVPRNLEEYIIVNTTTALDEIIVFGASANGSTSLSYIYYFPIEGASFVRYYETVGINVDKDDYTNYRRVFLDSERVFGNKLRRFSRTSSSESWNVVTYIVNGKLYSSKPMLLKNNSNSTKWLSDITPDFSESLKPKFTWIDDNPNNTNYLQLVLDVSDTFLSGTFTKDKLFQYNTVINLPLNEVAPPSLILNEDYDITVFGYDDDNWADLVIQKTFTTE